MENDFLKNLPSGQVREIVDYMEKKKVVAGAYVIKEGDQGKLLRQQLTRYKEYIYNSKFGDPKPTSFFIVLGSHLYVSAEGDYEVIKDGKVLGQLGIGKAFGELAILYNCRRTASIRGNVFLIHSFSFPFISPIIFQIPKCELIFSFSCFKWRGLAVRPYCLSEDHDEHRKTTFDGST